MSTEIASQSDYWNDEADSFRKIYSHEKSAFSNFLDKVFRKDMYERFVFTLHHSAPFPDKKFLDVGCGSGKYAVEFARKGAQHVTGIDIAENMLELSRRLAEQHSVQDRCTFLHTDLLGYELKELFDVSIGIGLFDYIANPFPVLSRMRQATTDRVVISFPRLWTWRAPVRKIRLATRRCPVYFYSRKRIERLMSDAGFSKMKIEKIGKLFCVVGYVNG
ncbi:MAG: class I SAM-dependent methyltransferase [Ignavibacteria bacterium]|nr:class I SAM-dependent methyltransferase [Ignavibacteria bacterium]MBI3765112.1 class I SAM-dependent methyltransferase [Ignavibacteriales bacterium]